VIGTTVGHYRILEKIGQGGMGVVYKAEDTKLKRTVALKFLRPGFARDPEIPARFVQEAQAAAALDHPNICSVYEINEAGDRTYIAMAYVDGRSLRQRIESGPLGVDEAANIAVQVAEGLREAHERGIIHRDVKPGNIMLTEKGLAKIMDFGLAKISSGKDLTETAAILGTAVYMSPEQAAGKKVDYRTDIWSLGCVLYEMLAGRRPFEAGHDQAVIHAILNEEAQPISVLRKDIPTEIEMILRKCLQKDPRNRYQDAAGLIGALRSVSGHGVSGSEAKTALKARHLSIAVLPFVDMSPQKDQEYFCDGIAEELINALTHIRDLRVVARTSAFAFKGRNIDVREIGKTLSVDTILEGSIRKAGTKLRVTAQLISIEDGYHLWSEKFDRQMDDIFAIQDEISTAIVENLRIKLLADERAAVRKRRANDPDAYNLYLKGLHFANRSSPESLHKALDCFSAAIGIDPDFAPAYVGTAHTYGAFGVLAFSAPAGMWTKAKTALEKALELDDELAEAHAVAALIAFYYDWDWVAAERSYRRTFSLNPGIASAHAHYAWHCLARGRFDEAVREIKLAQNLDPLMPLFYAFSTGIHGAIGRPDEAIEEFQRAVELDPNMGLAYFHAGTAYSQNRLMDKAISAFQKSRELAAYSGWAEGQLGIVYLTIGQREKAEAILEELLEKKNKIYVSSFCIGLLWGALGNLDKAFERMDQAIEERDSIMPFAHIYADIGALRSDSRFGKMMKKMNL
jgi:TolB-like protein/Tfp pilus assembly protein PilF/predicted Ser/Thr protein kinase